MCIIFFIWKICIRVFHSCFHVLHNFLSLFGCPFFRLSNHSFHVQYRSLRHVLIVWLHIVCTVPTHSACSCGEQRGRDRTNSDRKQTANIWTIVFTLRDTYLCRRYSLHLAKHHHSLHLSSSIWLFCFSCHPIAAIHFASSPYLTAPVVRGSDGVVGGVATGQIEHAKKIICSFSICAGYWYWNSIFIKSTFFLSLSRRSVKAENRTSVFHWKPEFIKKQSTTQYKFAIIEFLLHQSSLLRPCTYQILSSI